MILRRAAAGALLVVMLAGCVTRPAVVDPLIPGDRFSGRMSVQIEAIGDEPARSTSGAFELMGNAQRGRLDLTTPIGNTVARARWEPAGVFLETPQGNSQHPTLMDMTRTMLGEELPVTAMFDWLRGRPWPGADSVAASSGEPSGFHQLGWAVDLSRFDQARIVARRSAPPVVIVQVRLDQP